LKASIESAVTVLKLNPSDYDQIIVHAREAAPQECCGLIGGTSDGQAQSIYRTRNIAADPLVAYEAALEDLFAAQRLMRQRGEEWLAIYHSHPRSADPQPSATDVRLAYYPAAVYLIVGFRNSEPCVRAFRLMKSESRWEPAEYEIIDDESSKMS
jgi:proteasome lid subunit RPN8/RPN11